MRNDTMIYFVQINFGKRIGTAFVERDTADMDRKTTIQDIRDGQWRGDVVKVLECNPVENICNDVTDEILAAAFAPSLVCVGDHQPELVRS